MSELDLKLSELDDSSVINPNLAKTEDLGARPDCIDMAEIWDLPDDAATARTIPKSTQKMSVDLTGANLTGADLSNADLSEVVGLTQNQLNGALGNEGTSLPAGLTVKGC